MKKETIVGAVIGAIVLVVGIFIGSHYFGSTKVINSFSAGSATGTTFNSAKVATIQMSLSSATTTSILNTDSFDRIVESSKYWCTGVGSSKTAFTGAGLKELTLQFATSSVAASASLVVANTNTLLSTVVSTSSATVYVSSTTPTITDVNRIWASGTYLVPFTNATNTAQCLVGVSYLGS